MHRAYTITLLPFGRLHTHASNGGPHAPPPHTHTIIIIRRAHPDAVRQGANRAQSGALEPMHTRSTHKTSHQLQRHAGAHAIQLWLQPRKSPSISPSDRSDRLERPGPHPSPALQGPCARSCTRKLHHKEPSPKRPPQSSCRARKRAGGGSLAHPSPSLPTPEIPCVWRGGPLHLAVTPRQRARQALRTPQAPLAQLQLPGPTLAAR